MAMKERDALNVIREALMKRLRFEDSTVHAVTRPAVGGEEMLRLPNGIAIRLVWAATGRLAHRFNFTSLTEPILFMEVPATVTSLAELRPHFDALVPAFAAELGAHRRHGHLTIVGGDREAWSVGRRGRWRRFCARVARLLRRSAPQLHR